MKKYCYFDGDIVESGSVGIPLNDLAVLRGYAAFDFFRIYNRVPLHLEDHLTRFSNSADALGIALPITREEIEHALEELCDANECNDAHVRIIATGGTTDDGITPGKSLIFIIFEDMYELDKGLFENGATLITHEHQRFLPEAKTTSYAQAVMLQKSKKEAGAIEVLYVNDGLVLEPTTSNIAFVKGGVIVTPKRNVLQGLTKKTVLHLAKEAGIKVEERDVTIEELLEADEVFITAANKRVLPIVKIDEHTIADGKVGEVSKKLLQLYNDYIQKECYA